MAEVMTSRYEAEQMRIMLEESMTTMQRHGFLPTQIAHAMYGFALAKIVTHAGIGAAHRAVREIGFGIISAADQKEAKP